MRDDKERLRYINEAIEKIEKYVSIGYQDIPWADIVGLRNILVHQYFGIDIKQVWETAELDMPVLKARICGFLQEINDK